MTLTRLPAAALSSVLLFAAALCAAEPDGWTASRQRADSLAKQRPSMIYHEEKVPRYTLPEVLVAADGTKVTDAESWFARRRGEILELFTKYVYGRAPGRPTQMSFEVFDLDTKALGGTATRKQVSISLSKKDDAPRLDLLIYMPNRTDKPVGAFVLLNFGGNHTVNADPAIKLEDGWVRSKGTGVVDNRADESSRGTAAERFPLDLILDRGYALATIYYGDVDPDFDDGFQNGVHPLFDEAVGKSSSAKRSGDAPGSIAAWAWGLSRAMDYFEVDEDVDQNRVAVLGHSRLGKTSLWAGARDERFAVVISNDSGCGGAALSRRAYGETVERINTSFPHWFCENFKKYNAQEGDLPIDQHMLLALVAPRPLYVASADEDLWADPRGEFLSALAADPVYRLLGTDGLPVRRMPGVDSPVSGTIGYHVRSGRHNLSEYDWQQYLDFADRHMPRPK